MRKYFLFILISLFAAGFVFARPSFEIADHPWPDITPLNISQPPVIVVTARVEDISGIYSAGTIIKKGINTIGTYMMNDKASPPDETAEDHIYSVVINTSNYNPSNYSLDIFAADTFGSRKDLTNVQTFKIGQLIFTAPSYGFRGSTVNLSAVLKNSTGGPVANEPIVFEDTIDAFPIGQVNTNSFGIAQISYNIPLTASLGIHTLKAKCVGSSDFEETAQIEIKEAQKCTYSASVEGNTICVDISTQITPP